MACMSDVHCFARWQSYYHFIEPHQYMLEGGHLWAAPQFQHEHWHTEDTAIQKEPCVATYVAQSRLFILC